MTRQDFPFSPRTTSDLELGDLVAVPREDGRWGCLQVSDLKRSGAGARTSLVVGVLPWVGDDRPTGEAVAGLRIAEQGLTRMEIFTEGGLQVVATAPVVPHGLSSNFRDFEVGTKHNVWGWKTAIRRAAAFEA